MSALASKKCLLTVIFGQLSPCRAANFLNCPLSGRTLGVQRKQSPLGRQQIRQPEEGVQPRRVLRQSTVGHLLHAKEVLDDLERMFNLGPDGWP